MAVESDHAAPPAPGTAEGPGAGLSAVGSVAAGLVLVALTPRSAWGPACRAVAALRAVLLRRRAVLERIRVEQLLPELGAGAEAAALERIANGNRARLHGLAHWVPWRTPLPVALNGAEHLERALTSRRGAILWVARFAFAPLGFKMALAGSGFRVTHLSRPGHGFTAAPWAGRIANPIWTRVEERYLEERIVMVPGAPLSALRTLRERLLDNGIVSVTLGEDGARAVSVPFGRTQLRLATGPITLAARSGAPLLPVFTLLEPDGVVTAHIEAPLPVGLPTGLAGGSSGSRAEAARHVAVEYTSRLRPHALRAPGQWLG